MKNITVSSSSSETFLRIPPLLPILVFLVVSSASTAFAGSATWRTNPGSGDWNTAANWMPATVPNGPSDTAMFAFSNTTDVSLSATTEVNAVVFNPGSLGTNPFTITVSPTTQSTQFTISGSGITNNTGAVENFVVAGAPTIRGPIAQIVFTNNAIVDDDNLHFTVNGGPPNSAGSVLLFSDHSSAGRGTFTVNGGSVRNSDGGLLLFGRHATAANATLIALPGLSNKGLGGGIFFGDRSDGGTARVQLLGRRHLGILGSNGKMDISAHTGPGGGPGPLTIGSIEGNGALFLGPATLIVGSNNMNTTFSGVISWMGSHGGIGGGLVKIGTGKLVLTNANTYQGGTTIERGELVINNRTGSGTGEGPVQVDGGRLGGKGIVSGAVTVGTGTSPGAFLSPGSRHGVGRAGTLTIQSTLTFNSDATYEWEENSSSVTADEVAALGVTINSGAQFTFADLGTGTLPAGTLFTVINNTATTPIAGTFSNLPDGSTFTSGGTTFKANYEGGDGNDLILTVQ